MDTSHQQLRAAVIGTGQLGRVMAERFSAAGYLVAAVDRRMPEGLGTGVEGIAADLSTPEGVRAVCAELVRQPLDAVLLTAGAYAGGRTIEQTPPEELERLFWVNARLPFYVLHHLLPALRARKGRAILIGALGAMDARAKQVAYSASKSALHSIVQTAAQELKGSGATANALLPLTIDTPSNRADMPDRDPSSWVSPQRLADLALFLCSDAGRDVSGALIPVRGGN
ncbi:MAG: SDR family oxidoreductase [Thermaerobacter sp.]|nr:SDR family oxidoreductase [Thermaerobacter sp.]